MLLKTKIVKRINVKSTNKMPSGKGLVAYDPVSSQLNHFLANPSLIFWGFFGSFFSRKTDLEVVARAPA